MEEPTPQSVPEIEPLPAAAINEQGEPAVTLPASPEAQVLEAAVTNTVQ